MSVVRKTPAKTKHPVRPRPEKADAEAASADVAKRFPKILTELGK